MSTLRSLQDTDVYRTIRVVDEKALSPEGATTVKNRVEEYFADIPIMVTIASCESHFRHLGKDGTVLRGDINRSDLGVMQINEYYHGETAEKFGLDLHKLEDNLGYARNLYEREGTTPWNSSSACWEKKHVALN